MPKPKTSLPPEPRNRPGTAFLGAAALAAVALVVWLAWPQKPPVAPAAPAASVASATPTAAMAVPASAAAPKPAASYQQKPPEEGLKFVAAEQARTALGHYLEYSVFPPWSRPADGSQTHLWEWNKFEPHGQTFARGKDNKPISASLHLDRMFTGPGETLTATVLVWGGTYESEQKDPVDATVTGAIEVWRDAAPQSQTPSGWFPVATATFAAADGGPGKRFVSKIIPSTMPPLKRESEARFVATVAAGDHKMPFSETFRLAASTPLIVMPNHTDKIAAGSLQVKLAIDLKELGPVMIQATLFDATGQTPIAVYDNFYQPAQLGPQEVNIAFFGKAIRDKGIDGPYQVKALHGFVKVASMEPPEVHWSHETPLSTNAYPAASFSGEEWDAPEKQEKINQYKGLINQLENTKP